MIAIDTNILVPLLVRSDPEHQAMHEKLKNFGESLGTTSINLGESLRLLTHPKVFKKPMMLGSATNLISNFVDYSNLLPLSEEELWWKSLGELEKDVTGIRGNEVFDARIALCLRHNGVKKIWTKDTDFRRYSFLEIV